MLYSLYQLQKEGRLLRADGAPYRTKNGIRRRLRKFELKRERYNGQSELCYAITDEQLALMNRWEDLRK